MQVYTENVSRRLDYGSTKNESTNSIRGKRRYGKQKYEFAKGENEVWKTPVLICGGVENTSTKT